MNQAIATATTMFHGKRVLVIGLGLLGGAVGDCRFLVSLGAKVTATDLKPESELTSSINLLTDLPITFHLGGHRLEDVDATDVILRNPSIPHDHPMLQRARAKNIPVYMRSALFAMLAGIPLIGITGTRGKTTTTTMIHAILTQDTSTKILLGGNVRGVSDLELLRDIHHPDETITVMELSSWQLQGFAEAKRSPSIAVITNLMPDHLNHYPDLKTYYQDKKHILLHQTSADWAVLNYHQPELHHWARQAKSQISWFDAATLPTSLQLKLRGHHNRSNAAAALAVAKILSIDTAVAIRALNQFTGVEYRFQTIAIKNGIEYINDTTATSPDAAIAALSAVAKKPIIIAGGADKNLPVDTLIQQLNQRSKKIVLLQGTGTDRIIAGLDPKKLIGQADSMTQAVAMAKQAAYSGDIILLSPGFASFGLFQHEFDRGEQFNQCVNAHA